MKIAINGDFRQPCAVSPATFATHRQVLFGIVKNDAETEAAARLQPADAVADIDPVMAARTAQRAPSRGEDNRLAALERDRLATRLGAWALLCQQELTSLEIRAAPAKHHRHLKRKEDFA